MENNLKPGDAKRMILGCGGIVAIVFVVMIVGLIWLGQQPRDPNEWKRRDNSVAAYVLMKDQVIHRLKAPSTAKFPDQHDSDVMIARSDDHSYTVYGFVDAQNSFGAMIRTHYTGVIQQSGEEEWKLVGLTIEE